MPRKKHKDRAAIRTALRFLRQSEGFILLGAFPKTQEGLPVPTNGDPDKESSPVELELKLYADPQFYRDERDVADDLAVVLRGLLLRHKQMQDQRGEGFEEEIERRQQFLEAQPGEAIEAETAPEPAEEKPRKGLFIEFGDQGELLVLDYDGDGGCSEASRIEFEPTPKTFEELSTYAYAQVDTLKRDLAWTEIEARLYIREALAKVRDTWKGKEDAEADAPD